jgi:hypothetical protein
MEENKQIQTNGEVQNNESTPVEKTKRVRASKTPTTAKKRVTNRKAKAEDVIAHDTTEKTPKGATTRTKAPKKIMSENPAEVETKSKRSRKVILEVVLNETTKTNNKTELKAEYKAAKETAKQSKRTVNILKKRYKKIVKKNKPKYKEEIITLQNFISQAINSKKVDKAAMKEAKSLLKNRKVAKKNNLSVQD